MEFHCVAESAQNVGILGFFIVSNYRGKETFI